VGLFEYADRGSLFLDEVGDLDVTTQGKLLRVLETGEMQRLGAPETVVVDVRVICATHRDLQAMVKENKFRGDLYYRLKGVTIALPPLRGRPDDIPELVDYFVENHCAKEGIAAKVFEPAARDSLVDYDWPGNVRQLMDTVQSLIDLSPSQFITAEEVSRYLGCGGFPSGDRKRSLSDQVREFKKRLVIKALDHNHHNIRAAARELSMDSSNLRKLINDLNVSVRRADSLSVADD
jgi:transcriptional regulator with GAF, ATPase, and Fis domain